MAMTSATTGTATQPTGPVGIGLMNAIMFPTIFSLASEGPGSRALQFALLIPAVCYAVIAGFGLFARRPAPDIAAGATPIAVP